MPTIYREQGLAAALAKFTELTGVEVPPPPAEANPELRRELNPMADNYAYSFGHLMPAIIDFVPDLAALRALPTHNAPTRIVVGEDSTDRPPYRSALRLATDLGVPVVRFPGDHLGFTHNPPEFARRLRQILDDI
jgi:pimeloyl-ACP methyl ester carboxylesterase